MSSSVLRKQALAFITALDGPDYDGMADVMHEKFTHRFRPGSLNGMGKPTRSKHEFLSHVKDVYTTIERFNFLPPQEIIVGKDADGQDVVILHLLADGRTATGKPYNNEYVFIFRFEDEKILSIKEFMDSQYVTKTLAGESQAV